MARRQDFYLLLDDTASNCVFNYLKFIRISISLIVFEVGLILLLPSLSDPAVSLCLAL